MARRARLRTASLAAAVSALTACSLLLDSGLNAGTGSETDAASGDGNVEDARGPVDSGASDSSSPLDASDAPDGQWCVNGPTRFCDDFDDASPGSLWSRAVQSKGEIAFDGLGLSAPNALRTSTAGAGGLAYLSKTLSAPPAVRCELDMKLVDVPATGDVSVFEIVSNPEVVGEYKLYLVSFDGPWYVAEYQEQSDGGVVESYKRLSTDLPVGEWFHLTFDATPTAATVSVKGESTVLDGIQPPPGATRQVRVGHAWTSEEVVTSEVLFDNVDCTF